MAKEGLVSEQPKFLIRFPEELRDRIKAEAVKNNRTMTTEIIERLQESFAFSNTEEHLEARIRNLSNEVDRLDQENAELEEEIKRRHEREIERLGEIRALRIDRKQFETEVEIRQAEILEKLEKLLERR